MIMSFVCIKLWNNYSLLNLYRIYIIILQNCNKRTLNFNEYSRHREFLAPMIMRRAIYLRTDSSCATRQ